MFFTFWKNYDYLSTKKMKRYKHYACKKCGEFIVNNWQRLRIQFKCLVSNNDYRSTTVSQYSYIQTLDEYLAFNDGQKCHNDSYDYCLGLYGRFRVTVVVPYWNVWKYLFISNGPHPLYADYFQTVPVETYIMNRLISKRLGYSTINMFFKVIYNTDRRMINY